MGLFFCSFSVSFKSLLGPGRQRYTAPGAAWQGRQAGKHTVTPRVGSSAAAGTPKSRAVAEGRCFQKEGPWTVLAYWWARAGRD